MTTSNYPGRVYSNNPFAIPLFAASQKIYKAVIQINPVLNRYNIDNEEYSAKLSLFTIGWYIISFECFLYS